MSYKKFDLVRANEEASQYRARLDGLEMACREEGWQMARRVGTGVGVLSTPEMDVPVAAAESAVLALYDKALVWRGLAQKLATVLVSQMHDHICSGCKAPQAAFRDCDAECLKPAAELLAALAHAKSAGLVVP
jgi:hypothetical protein